MVDRNDNNKQMNEAFAQLLAGQRESNKKQERMIDLLSNIAGQTKTTRSDIEADAEPETSLMNKLFFAEQAVNYKVGLYSIDNYQKITNKLFEKLIKSQEGTTASILENLTSSVMDLVQLQRRTIEVNEIQNDLLDEGNSFQNIANILSEEMTNLMSAQLDISEEEMARIKERTDEAERDRAQSKTDRFAQRTAFPEVVKPAGGKGGGIDPKILAGGAVGGALLAGKVMSIGIGIGAALVGFGVAAGGVGYLINVLGKEGLGKNIADNASALLELNTDNVETIAAADVAGALGVLGAGLAAFGVGGTAANISEIVNTFGKKIGGRDFATAVKEDLETLLSINADSNDVATLKGLDIAGAMTSIALGLVPLAVGEFVNNLGKLSSTLSQKLGGRPFAMGIKEDIETLLSIKVPEDAGFMGTGFAGFMTEMTVGLLVLSVGEFASGVSGLVSTLDTKLGDGKRFAEGIKSDVETLLSIGEDHKDAGFMGTGFAGLMTELSVGVGVFAGAEFLSGIAGLVSTFDAKMGDGKRFTEGLADEVETLLTLSGTDKRQQARDFSGIMGSVAFGLSKITAIELVDAIVGIGEGFINFFTGNESPLQAVVELAKNADDLEKGSDAIVKLADALQKISALKFDGSKINMKEFAEDLVESVPAIEAAIMGGDIDESIFPTGHTYFKGLASPDIDFATATRNILMLRGALSDEIVTAKELELMNMMNNGQSPTINNVDGSSQVIQNSSTGFVIGGQAKNSDLEKYKLSTN